MKKLFFVFQILVLKPINGQGFNLFSDLEKQNNGE